MAALSCHLTMSQVKSNPLGNLIFGYTFSLYRVNKTRFPNALKHSL